MLGYSDDDIKNAAEIREWLTKQILEKQDEIEKIKINLSLIDSVLKQGSFKTAANLNFSKKFSPNEQKNEMNSMKKTPNQYYEKHRGDEEQTEPREQAVEETRLIKRLKDNTPVARVHVTSEEVIIIPEDPIKISIETPPFRSFFLNRILQGMRNKDLDKIKQGQLSESDMISYDIITENENKDILKKIQITNYRDKERINEIFNTAAWVLTRMLDKVDK
ncbi:hypothetical protein [Candidatus Nitrosocosmicus arcticus]|uniref:Uncharacterized protein n=1 Tax=Candidatus Nitrosocosmicus arcticus TaxID=2035267 RepID=A0A557SSC8_9ARCH|nr:hypothetical protein [Candidatus Nitrosocosmicus arcticus]TVP39511.1 hypothetical protein NARC_150105 [Candidatus Nitrosocosmicus arcticus]